MTRGPLGRWDTGLRAHEAVPSRGSQRAVRVGLGVIDVRGERLQSVEEIEDLAVAAASILPPERIALNPDCGFAPDSGEPPMVDEAYEKLRRLVAAARKHAGCVMRGREA